MDRCLMVLVLAWQASDFGRKGTKQRRQLRLLQVREQSKQIAKNIRVAVKTEQQRQFETLRNHTKNLQSELQEEEIEESQRQYSECLNAIGEGHKHATKQNLLIDQKRVKLQEDAKIAKLRGKAGFLTLQKEKEEIEQNIQTIQKKRQLLAEKEKNRSRAIASLPPPIPNPIDRLGDIKSKKGKKPKPKQFSDSRHFAMKQTNSPSIIITTDNGLYSTKSKRQVNEKVLKEIPLEQSSSKYVYNLENADDTDYECYDDSYDKENYRSMDFVTRRKPRKSGFVPDVKFRVFNGNKRRRKSVNRKSVGGKIIHPMNKEPQAPLYDAFNSEEVRVEKLTSAPQDLNAFELADRLSETLHQVQCVQENKKENFAEKAKLRHNAALKELQSQKASKEVLDELKDFEIATRIENKKQYLPNSRNEFDNFKNDEVQLKMEKIVENILKPEEADNGSGSSLCVTPTSSLNSSSFFSWKRKHSDNKKKVYFPPFQQSPPLSRDGSPYNVNNARESGTPTNTYFPNEVKLYQQQLLLRAKERKELLGLFSPFSVQSTSTPNVSPKNFSNFIETSVNRKEEEVFTPNSECNSTPDSASESNCSSSQDILKAFLLKRGILGPNSGPNSPCPVDENLEEKSTKQAFHKRKFFTDPSRLSFVSDGKLEASPQSSTTVNEDYSKALSQAAKDLEISEIKLKLCEKEKEKIEEEQDFLKSQLMELRKSMSPRVNSECKDSPTEIGLNEDYRYGENTSPVLKNSLKSRERGSRSRPPVMFKRGMDITPFELSTIYEGDTSISGPSSVDLKNPKYCNDERLNTLQEFPEEETNRRIKEKSLTEFPPTKMEKPTVKKPIEISETNSLKSSNLDANNHDSWNYALMNERGITDQSCVTFNDTELTVKSPCPTDVLSPISDWKLCKLSKGSPLIYSPFSKKSDDQMSKTDSLLSFERHEMSACMSDFDTP